MRPPAVMPTQFPRDGPFLSTMISRLGLFTRGDHPASDAPSGTVSATRAAPARLLQRERLKRRAMVSAVVVADRIRCVECGICTFNCPLGIDVRSHVRLGQPVADSHCLTCGECVARCPRGTLRFEVSSVFTADPIRAGG